VLCSIGVDSLVFNVDVLFKYVTSDHKPLVASMSPLLRPELNVSNSTCKNKKNVKQQY